MLDQYQIQLTRMLEAEQFMEAKGLLQFLLQCQGQDKQHYEEWESLLTWLDMAFPDASSDGALSDEQDAEADEEALRAQLLSPPEHDEAYVSQVLYIMQHHPMIDQQMLALERAAYMKADDIDEKIISWLQSEQVHPVVQFKALQCLRRRGATGSITLTRLEETVHLDLEATPLSMDDFPLPINQILERTERMAEVDDPTMPHFARELWKESIQFLYGTTAYQWMLSDDEAAIDSFAAALHLTISLMLYGSANDDDIRDTYGITESSRFRYEQACRTLRQVAMLLQTGEDEHQP